jgi:hypothetical protein
MCREKRKKILGFYFFFWVSVTDKSIGGTNLSWDIKRRMELFVCCVCIIGEWIETFPMDFDTAEGRPGYSQTSPSPIISQSKRSVDCPLSTVISVFHCYIGVKQTKKQKLCKRLSRIVLCMSCTHIILMVADIIKIFVVNFFSWKFVSRTKLTQEKQVDRMFERV